MKLKENIDMAIPRNSYSTNTSHIVRTTQHWLPKAIDTGLTLTAWIGFLYLLTTGFLSLMQAGMYNQRSGNPLLETLSSMAFYLVLAGVMISGFLAWAKYSQLRVQRFDRRKRVPEIARQKLAQSFRVHPGVLSFLQHQQRLVVHSDEQGHVQAFEFLTLGRLHAANEPIRLDDALLSPIVSVQGEEWEDSVALQA